MVFGNKKVSLFRTIEEKILRRIDDWKHKLLSGTGRETLIKAVLQAIPLYAMSCFKVSLTVCKKITSHILRFWWHSPKNRGIHWLRAADLYEEKGLGGIGFRDLMQMNMALLAKQGWRLMTKPDLLVSKVFKARYFPNSELINASKGTRPSFAWRGIVEALDIIKMGSEWEEREGKYRWRWDSSGEFTVKSAYLFARKLEEQKDAYRGGPSEQWETKKFWRGFWRLKIPNKIKIFGWRLFHDGLPTMQNLARRGCNVTDVCWHCGSSGESSLHLFRDCWWIRGLLQDVSLPKGVWENQCGDPGYWLWLCAKLCSQEEFVSLLGGLWMGWKNRNDKAHGQQGGDILFLRLRLKCIIREWMEGIQPLNWWEELSNQGENHPVIFCDGSVDQSLREAGVGAVLMLDGSVSSVLAKRYSNSGSVLLAELRAVHLGLELAKKKGLPKVTILSDSAEAIWALNVGSWRIDEGVTELKDCIKALDDHADWHLGSINRDSNMMADWIARKARVDRWEWTDVSSVPSVFPFC